MSCVNISNNCRGDRKGKRTIESLDSFVYHLCSSKEKPILLTFETIHSMDIRTATRHCQKKRDSYYLLGPGAGFL